MGSTIYTGVFFSDGSHMTLTFRPDQDTIDTTPFGKTVCVMHTGDMSTDEFYGISVKPVSDMPTISSGEPHITMGTFGGFKPGNIPDRMKSNPEIITPVKNGRFIYGTVGRFMSDGKVHFE